MPVGLLTLEIHLPYAHSLKEKRLVLQKIKDRFLRETVLTGSDAALRLVKKNIRVRLRDNSFAIDTDLVLARVDRRGRLNDLLAIDAHVAAHDQIKSLAPGTNAVTR